MESSWHCGYSEVSALRELKRNALHMHVCTHVSICFFGSRHRSKPTYLLTGLRNSAQAAPIASAVSLGLNHLRTRLCSSSVLLPTSLFPSLIVLFSFSLSAPLFRFDVKLFALSLRRNSRHPNTEEAFDVENLKAPGIAPMPDSE